MDITGLTGRNELAAKANEHWRKVAEYGSYVEPLIIRLEGIDWPAIVAREAALWHRAALHRIRERRRLYGSYCWVGKYYNPLSGGSRLIQRYPLACGLDPTRLCLPSGPAECRGFKLADLHRPDWLLEASAVRSYETQRTAYRQYFTKEDSEQGNNPHRRQYLADRLRNISKRLGKYEERYYSTGGPQLFRKENFVLHHTVRLALEGRATGAFSPLDAGQLGELIAEIEHFWRCLKEFGEAEAAPPAATNPPQTDNAAPAASKAELKYIKPFYTQFLEIIGEAAASVEKEANELGYTIIAPETESTPAPQPLDTPAPSSPRPELPEKPTAPPALLSSADLILGPGFTLDDADQLARTVGLTDDAGNYCLGPRKLGAVVGFALALQRDGKLTGAIPDLTAVLAPRWGVQVATRKTGTGVAEKYFKLTNKALARPKKTD